MAARLISTTTPQALQSLCFSLRPCLMRERRGSIVQISVCPSAESMRLRQRSTSVKPENSVGPSLFSASRGGGRQREETKSTTLWREMLRFSGLFLRNESTSRAKHKLLAKSSEARTVRSVKVCGEIQSAIILRVFKAGVHRRRRRKSSSKRGSWVPI